MFCTDAERRVAKKEHRCTWCCQPIVPGTPYDRWLSIEDSAFVNKVHLECHDALRADFQYWGDPEYTPFENERPTVTVEEG